MSWVWTPAASEDSCPLCSTPGAAIYAHDRRRPYLQCQRCGLVFVPTSFHLSLEAEKRQYDHHENSPADWGYRRFLSRLAEPLLALLPARSSGLDFGSGPGPTLSVMLEEAGHQVALFDPFYAPDETVWLATYDFITTTEVVEHLRHPREELARLWGCLRPAGYLAIMTKQVRNAKAFSEWHYKNDPTHICFYSVETFQWLATQWGSEAHFAGADVVLFQKSHKLS